MVTEFPVVVVLIAPRWPPRVLRDGCYSVWLVQVLFAVSLGSARETTYRLITLDDYRLTFYRAVALFGLVRSVLLVTETTADLL